MSRRLALAVALAAACGPGSPEGPNINNRMSSNQAEDAPPLQSNDILAREARTNRAMVKHILVGWKDVEAGAKDGRAKSRTRAEADALAQSLLDRVRKGEAIEPLMSEFSEDPGSADGDPYEVTPGASLVFEFKRLGLRLDVGEAGLVLSRYGWHVIKRVE